MPRKFVIIGAGGSIGRAFCEYYANQSPDNEVHAFSRQDIDPFLQVNVTHHILDYADETQIESAANVVAKDSPLDCVIVATGILHDEGAVPAIKPEKNLRQLSEAQFQAVFAANTITPALIAKHFIPKLNRTSTSVFAALSARVGSISDNELGGWYSYRASKAALNMLIKTGAIETKRTNKQAIIIGLHPGTVDSPLSQRIWQVLLISGR